MYCLKKAIKSSICLKHLCQGIINKIKHVSRYALWFLNAYGRIQSFCLTHPISHNYSFQIYQISGCVYRIMLTHRLLFSCHITVSVKTCWHFGSEYLAQYECDESDDETVKFTDGNHFQMLCLSKDTLGGDLIC